MDLGAADVDVAAKRRRDAIAASVSLPTAAAILAAVAHLSAVDAAGLLSTRARRGGGAFGSGGPLTMKKPNGVPEAGRGMGVARTSRSWRQARSNSARVSSAGRTATAPQMTVLGVGVDIARVDCLELIKRRHEEEFVPV